MADKIYIQSRLNRTFHWITVVNVILLLTSGFYIHNPVDLGNTYSMDVNVLIQTVTAFLQSGIVAAWVYYKLVTGSDKDIVFRTRDINDLKGLLKYYFFVENKPPVHGKYNAGQRLVFTSWFIVFLFMFLTGLLIYSVNFGYMVPFPIIMQKIRFYHYLGALWFLGTVPVHIYLVFTEDPAKLQAMFTGWVRK